MKPLSNNNDQIWSKLEKLSQSSHKSVVTRNLNNQGCHNLYDIYCSTHDTHNFKNLKDYYFQNYKGLNTVPEIDDKHY